ncbi:MAG: DUF4918 family protein [Cyclobacteriaceae bacterium]|jgi:hypothetical protein|nr:DUF4918 family protein [Cyclobacteriaceae bacterium]
MDSNFFSQKVLLFFKTLKISASLPKGVEVLNPYHDRKAFELCKQFYNQYYADSNNRKIILGINPGRLGAGLTGIPFTDPIKLKDICGINNALPRKAELSADFIYQMINAYGGPLKFYQNFYITSVSPLGFTKDGKNLNYYDDKKLIKQLNPFILSSITKQLQFGIDTKTAYCLGEGENYKFLSKLNAEHQFFENLIPLAHPRFIMQYKRKSLNHYMDHYMEALHHS